MMSRRTHLLAAALVAVSFALGAWLYGRLPDPVPTHFDAHGVANGWMPKPWGVFVMPLVQVGLWLLLAVLPAISPRGYRMERFGGVYERIVVFVLAFMTVVCGLALAQASGAHVALPRVIVALVGALDVGIGNYLGKTTPNFFVGVRTPWTLASPEVWTRTHRLAGWLFVASGVAMIVAAVLFREPFWAVALIAVPAIVPIVHSYVVYKRIEGFTPPTDAQTPPAPEPPRGA